MDGTLVTRHVMDALVDSPALRSLLGTEDTLVLLRFVALVLVMMMLVWGLFCTGGQKPAPRQVAVHDVQVQSQTTYTFNSRAPRFTPLPEYAHGAWRV